MTPPGTAVAPEDWVAAVEESVGRGFVMLDLLTAVDRDRALEVVVHLLRPDDAAGEFRHTWVTGPRLASLTPMMAAAAWHEREIREMFGLEFDGLDDPRPLLLQDGAPARPLRKSTPLPARVETPWPGASGESGGRARRVPGVPPAWSRGDGLPGDGLPGEGSGT